MFVKEEKLQGSGVYVGMWRLRIKAEAAPRSPQTEGTRLVSPSRMTLKVQMILRSCVCREEVW